jgi:hypothetical protein
MRGGVAQRRWWDRQRLYFQAQYLLGAIDDATYLTHPWRYRAPAELQLLKGLRSDAQGDAAAALAGYRAWQATPLWQRDEFPNPVWREFVA